MTKGDDSKGKKEMPVEWTPTLLLPHRKLLL